MNIKNLTMEEFIPKIEHVKAEARVAKLKYVMHDFDGVLTPILFPAYIAHSWVEGGLGKPISAGFYDPETREAWGDSQSLGKVSRVEDGEIIARMLNGGSL